MIAETQVTFSDSRSRFRRRCGCLSSLFTLMITDQIGLHSVLLPLLIIYTKKLLESDWPRAVQFKCKPVQITHRNSG